MANKFKAALKDVTDICKFETWLRFYFTQEVEDQLFIKIPEETLTYIQNEYPFLAQLAHTYNHKAMTPESAQRDTVEFIHHNLDGQSHEYGMVAQVLNSKSFTNEISVFNMWVQAHEEQLDAKVMDFVEWMQLFEAWKRTETGQNILTGHTTGANATTETTQ